MSAVSEATASRPPESRAARVLKDVFRSRVAAAAFFVLLAVILAAVLAPVLAPQNPYDLAQIDIMNGTVPPGGTGYDGTAFWLGSDDQGRDMLSAIMYGLRISLGVGVMSGVAALAIGLVVGLCAAYFGGRVDAVVMRIVDIQLGFPTILIALVLLAVLGRGVDKVVIALIATQWVYFARTVRGSALVERKKEYIEAAHCLALGTPRIVLGHLLPNCLPPLIVVATVEVANAIAMEATLSFLGIGLPVTEPSLGLLISNGYEYMLTGKYWLSFFPGVALLVVITSINLVADRLREVLNPRLQG